MHSPKQGTNATIMPIGIKTSKDKYTSPNVRYDHGVM